MCTLKDEFFPDMITTLPEADTPVEGLHSHLFQEESQQFVSMSFENDVEVPEHCHEAQWAVVLDGENGLTINGKSNSLTKGDTYFIAKGIKHSARIKKGYKDLTPFNQKDRYKAK